MIAARANAPTIAWLLTAVTCLLAGMAIAEGRHQTVPLLALPAADGMGSAPSVDPPPPTLATEVAPAARFEGIPIAPAPGPVVLLVARITVRPGGSLPSETPAGQTVIMVESGSLSVVVDGAVWVGQGLDSAQTETVLGQGDRLVIAPGARYLVRNDRPMPAVALVVAIEGDAPSVAASVGWRLSAPPTAQTDRSSSSVAAAC